MAAQPDTWSAEDDLPDVLATATAEVAARFMVFSGTTAVRVFAPGSGEVLGYVSDRDIAELVAHGRDPARTRLTELAAAHPHGGNGRHYGEVSHGAEELTAGQIMTSPGIVCRTDATMREVAELLADREVSGVAVVDDDGAVVGVISERDLARALGAPLMRLALHGMVRTGPFLREPRVTSRRAADVMTSPAIVAAPDMPLGELAGTMVIERINRIPVVKEGRLLGVVTRGDVLAAVARLDHRDSATGAQPTAIG